MFRAWNTKLAACFFPSRCVCCNVILPPDEMICGSCRKRMVEAPQDYPFAGCLALYLYQEPVRGMLTSFKTREQPAKAAILGKLLVERLVRELDEPLFDLTVSVPMTARDRRRRSFNQSELLARAVASVQKIRYRDVLQKTRQTRSQHTLGRNARLHNVEDAFCVPKPLKVQGKCILLIDDIVTTGSTLRECRRVLLAAGAKKVVCMAVAVSPLHHHPL